MNSRHLGALLSGSLAGLLATLSCSLFSAISPPTGDTQPIPLAVPDTAPGPVLPVSTPTTAVVHVLLPSSPGVSGQLVYDVISEDTAPERRAPYGDSYNINRLERPFTQDMTYVPDLDVVTYTVSGDATWWYVAITLVGGDPNNVLNPHYGVELDKDHDGFGDFLIWAHPPYTQNWETGPVQIFQDTDHDTGGSSAEKSDAVISTDGYDALVFNGGDGDADPDLAWVRIIPGSGAQVQFAFKKAWSGPAFMLGVISDAGLRDPAMLDYVDRFTLAEAGSPVRDNAYYPLRALFAVDNSCREAFGFSATGYEPQLCPRLEPTKKPRIATEVPSGCPDPGNCPYGWAGEPYCYCIPG